MFDIYFDNSATTQVSEAAAQAAWTAMREEYGNPSSVHGRGVAAFRVLQAARQTMAGLLRCPAEEVYFTSCGSESNNTAIYGAASAGGKERRRLLISAVEHPSMLEPCKYLQEKGCELELIPVDREGVVDLERFAALLDERVALVGVMQVNNENGAIQPLTEIGALVREKSPQAHFHVDGVQAFCRLPVELARWDCDSYAASGHKIHAPKGVGLLWLKKSRHLAPLLRGGSQEARFRAGTENMPGIAAFAAAARETAAAMPENMARMAAVRRTLYESLSRGLEGVASNSPADDARGAAHILNLSFAGTRSEVLLHYLEEQGIYVSAGSACTAKSSKGSRVLQAMGITPERIDSALRFSFSRYNTTEEAAQAAAVIVQAVTDLRAVMRGKR